MTTIQLQVPEAVAGLIPKVGDKFLLIAIRDSLTRLIEDEREELEKVHSRIETFSQKYKATFESFENQMPESADYGIHEDYGEWSHLIERAKIIENEIAGYQSGLRSTSPAN